MNKPARRQRQTAKGHEVRIGQFTKNCPRCHLPGLFIYYHYKERHAQWVCGPRDLPNGEFIMGCNQIVYDIPMTKDEYHQMLRNPKMREMFFYLEVPNDENL